MKKKGIDIAGTISRIEKSLGEDRRIPSEFRVLVELLLVVVKLLVDQATLNSRNSHKSPSTDPHRPRGRRKRVKGVRSNIGGQPGHKGHYIEPLSDPDEVEFLEIDRKTLPKGMKYTSAGYESRQVIDLVVERRVTEYRAEVLKDENSARWVAIFPEGVTRPVQYGSGLKAKAVYLSQAQLIPYERIEQYFRGEGGIEVSQGSLVNFNRQAYKLLEPFEKMARAHLTQGPVLHNDETGINVGGKLHWLHSASNEKWTLFFPHERRGAQAMEAFGILPRFEGVSVHDHWKPYLNFDCKHAFCNAHHLRELERAWEQDRQRWARNMRRLLLKMNDVVTTAGGKLSEKRAEPYRKKYRSLIRRAERECPDPSRDAPRKRGRPKKNKARNLLERLGDHEADVLRFLTDDQVPFTNNLSERDIRMTKVQQKISGCFRSIDGARTFCRVRSYLSTCRKHNVQHADALRLLFEGKSIRNILSP